MWAAAVENPPTGNRKAIPAEVKRQVWSRDQGQSTYQDPVSGQKCGARYQLEFDHWVPVANGGDHSIENLRVRCKAHNLWEASRVFGKTKMGRYVECSSYVLNQIKMLPRSGESGSG